MKTVRKAFAWVSLLLLGGGYVGAMAMSMTGQSASWAEKMDQAPVRGLALVMLLAAVVFAFLPEKEADS